ncbi:NUDIX domain-containing protein [Roseibium sediminicola]|uniref:NUDIX domain-containing protein n=1 Tax=Roseibium sediminicola TaxID=2933272 RepID=A0ABT0GXY1_9HYPH|nr:NUDIX domain-containing protein [Roseibium sp. CAU 1639]MCK7614297.1 NUDIX domain-containing protein [Roseibium sp. CAU 1639]
MSTYHYGVFVGRFQPLHIGHEAVIRAALKQVDTLIVLIGSSAQARTPRNPFTHEERAEMFAKVFKHELATDRLILKPVPDHPYSDTAWCTEVQRAVNETVLAHYNRGGVVLHGLDDIRIALAGYGKDRTSYYLKLFPEWGNVQLTSQYGTFSSSDIRRQLFQRIPAISRSVLSDEVAGWLEDFSLSETFRDLLEEAEYLDAYPKDWGRGPFVTVDAVVIQSGHILLVERGQAPGKGLLALPGGFLDPSESIRDAAIRELKEETAISDHKGEIPPAMLASFIDGTKTRVFDHPDRSLRGRIITHAFLFRLPERRELFSVTGGDDARAANWYRLGDLKPEQFFEDHWSIIDLMADL